MFVRVVPCPVGLEEGGVVDNGGEEGGEGPQQEGGEKLGDDGVLEDRRTGAEAGGGVEWWEITD